MTHAETSHRPRQARRRSCSPPGPAPTAACRRSTRRKVTDLQPALEAGMAQQLAEIDRIANDPAAPTFDNTIAAMERTGRTLDRAITVYGIYSSTLNDDAVQAVEREMAPKLAAFSDQITQNAEAVRAHRAGLRDARDVGPDARAAAARPGCTTRTSSAPAPSSTPRPRSALPRSTRNSPRCSRPSARTCSKDENEGVIYIEQRGGPRRPAAGRARRHGAGRRRPRPEGQVGDRRTRARASSRS